MHLSGADCLMEGSNAGSTGDRNATPLGEQRDRPRARLGIQPGAARQPDSPRILAVIQAALSMRLQAPSGAAIQPRIPVAGSSCGRRRIGGGRRSLRAQPLQNILVDLDERRDRQHGVANGLYAVAH